jgi:hypothetical protein
MRRCVDRARLPRGRDADGYGKRPRPSHETDARDRPTRVVTLWSTWLTAPVAILNAYTQWGRVWIPFVFVSLGAAIYVARTRNTRAVGRVPSVAASGVGRLAPLIVLATVAIGHRKFNFAQVNI